MEPGADDGLATQLRTHLEPAFALERELGGGGMSRVFVAQERAFGRRVVIKVLPPELAAGVNADRFRREMTVAAKLQHPHIVPVLSAGEAAGTLYYTMPFVHGESLRARIAAAGRLAVDDALRIVDDVAGALDYAHRQGVVHRDIKPENILLSEGHALVVDFGIARALSADTRGEGSLTATGMVIGTAAYMSPEQASGEPAIDGRSDVYSLGCVLYEMLAGEPPFSGETMQAVISRRFIAPAPPLAKVRPSLPAALGEAVGKSMALEPAGRFPTASAFATSLARAVSPVAAPSSGDDSIVVLPFANVSPDPDSEYFSDGLTDEVITDLAQIHSLRVISRNSAMLLKGTEKDTRTIGRELGVRYVLQGTVRRAGSALRVTAQLTDAASDATLWAEKYSGELDDVFEIQERLSREIVGALRLKLTRAESERVGRRQVKDPIAYDCYLRARQHVLSGAPERFAAARELLDRAMGIVGENPLILAAMAQERFFAMMSGLESDPAIYVKALSLAERAIELDPLSAEAHGVAGLVHKAMGDIDRAISSLESALRIEPNLSGALMTLAWVGADVGRPDEARILLARARAASPFESTLPLFESIVALFDGRFEEALAHAEAFRRAEPASPFGSGFRMLSLGFLGLEEEQRLACEEFAREYAGRADVEAIAALTLGMLDGRESLLDGLTDAQLAHAGTDCEIAWWAAHCLASNGETHAAVDWLGRAVALGFLNHPFVTRLDPALETLRGHEPYDQLVRDLEQRWRAIAIPV